MVLRRPTEKLKLGGVPTRCVKSRTGFVEIVRAPSLMLIFLNYFFYFFDVKIKYLDHTSFKKEPITTKLLVLGTYI